MLLNRGAGNRRGARDRVTNHSRLVGEETALPGCARDRWRTEEEVPVGNTADSGAWGVGEEVAALRGASDSKRQRIVNQARIGGSCYGARCHAAGLGPGGAGACV